MTEFKVNDRVQGHNTDNVWDGTLGTVVEVLPSHYAYPIEVLWDGTWDDLATPMREDELRKINDEEDRDA